MLLKVSVGLLDFPVLRKLFVIDLCGWCSDSGCLCFMADKKRNSCWEDEGSCEQTS